MKTLVALCIALFAPLAMASNWPQEPTSFRSIKLGEPLQGQFPECPKDKSGTYSFAPQITCWQSDGKPNQYAFNAVLARIYNLPDVGVLDTLVKGDSYTLVALLDGKVANVVLIFNSGLYESFLETLTQKYGTPHTALKIPYLTSSGASIEGAAVGWSGPNISISYAEFGSDLRNSRLDVSTSAYMAAQKASATKQTQQHVDAL